MSKFLTIKAPPITVELNMAVVERDRGRYGDQDGDSGLTRVWASLLKDQNEIQFSPNPQATAEMVMIPFDLCCWIC